VCSMHGSQGLITTRTTQLKAFASDVNKVAYFTAN